MEQILAIMNQECHYAGNLYQCKWCIQHFAGMYVRDYCYNYNMMFKICKSCQSHSNSLVNMISRKSLILAVLTKQEADIKKLEKRVKKMNTSKNTSKKEKKVPSTDKISEYLDVVNIDHEEVCVDSPRNEPFTIEPENEKDEDHTDDDTNEESIYIMSEKIRLLPQTVKFKEEIELYKLHDGDS